jgi:hypothetical protein
MVNLAVLQFMAREEFKNVDHACEYAFRLDVAIKKKKMRSLYFIGKFLKSP